MEEQNSGFRGMHESIQSMSRDALAVTFRRRRLIRKAFLWALLGGVLAVMLFGIQYESDSEIAVRPWARTAAAITPDQSPRPMVPGDNNGVEEAINSEIEILTADDILQHVVVTCGLQYGGKHWYTPYKLDVYRAIPGYWDTLIPNAISKLNGDLEIDEVKTSNMLTIAYTAKDATQAACVTRALMNFYMAKHTATWRPAKIFDFFSEQADDYRKRLYSDEQKLLDFAREQDAADAQAQLGIDVNQEGQFLASLRTVRAGMAANRAQVQSGEEQLKSLPARVDQTQSVSDNYQLMAQLKSSLVNLELQRTSLLVKYDPNYPLVKAVDTQIAQAQQAIADQQAQPVRDNNTGPNPVVMYLQQAGAQDKVLLAGQQDQANILTGIVKQYHDEALAADQKMIAQNDLQREINAMQGNYVLYLSKREEARINDMLDARQVDNVTVMKSPTIPVIPIFDPRVLLLLAVILAAIIAVALAFVVDYLDPSFRTPDEVQEFLNVPVFASIPENGQEAVVGAVSKNGH
ncbi:MAG TPA: hypothetical protein VL523_02300 [Terriglobia bacterium]|nr:hypothetical protein [Terriglobia bacterium]